MKCLATKVNPSLDKIEDNCVDQKRKRREFDSTNNISLSNDNGVTYFHGGKPAEAKTSFLAAFNAQRVSTSSIVIQPFDSHDLLNNEIARVLATSKAECQSRKKVCNPYHEVKEYDEGMNVFMDVLQINESLSLEFQYAIIFYNIGQTCFSSKEFEEAKDWFALSLTIVETFDDNLKDGNSLNLLMVQHGLGNCCYRLGDIPEAMEYYQKALQNALTVGHGKLELAATYNCIGVLYLQSSPSDSTKAVEFFRLGLSIHRKLVGGTTKEIGTFLNNIGRALHSQSEFDDALKVYLEALKVRREALGNESIDVAATVINVGQTQQHLGNLDEAMGCYREFVDIISSQLGVNNGDIATAYKCMGKVFTDRGDMDAARSMFEQALQAERAVYGKYHPKLAPTMNILGSLCFEMNNNDDALQYFRAGLKIEKKDPQTNFSNIIITLRNIAQIHKDNSDYAEAICVYKEVYMRQMEQIKHSPEVASTLCSLGLMYFLLKQYWFSLIYYQGALKTYKTIFGCDKHKEVALTLNCIGLCYYKLKTYGLSLEAFLQCIKIRQNFDTDHLDLADVCHNLGSVFAEIGDDDHAILYYQDALRIEQRVLGEGHYGLRTTLQQLGQFNQSRGNYDEAIKYFTTVLDLERKAKNEDSIFKLLNVIGNLHLMNGDIDQMMACYIAALRSGSSSEGAEIGCLSLVVVGHNAYVHSKLHPRCAEAA